MRGLFNARLTYYLFSHQMAAFNSVAKLTQLI